MNGPWNEQQEQIDYLERDYGDEFDERDEWDHDLWDGRVDWSRDEDEI